MSIKQLRVGVIGCGAIGREHIHRLMSVVPSAESVIAVIPPFELRSSLPTQWVGSVGVAQLLPSPTPPRLADSLPLCVVLPRGSVLVV